MPTRVDALLGAFQKEHGKEVGGIGPPLPDVGRCPTGIMALDIALGGGIPLNRMTLLYGPKGSTKTNTGLCCIREYQRLWPKRQCVLIEPEGRLTEPWIRRCGVDYDNLGMLWPATAEQCADMIERLLYADDIGLIVLDSIAAMQKMATIEGGHEKGVVGGASMAINRMVNACTLALVEARKGGRSLPSMLWINQLRMKAGPAAAFGNPETLPGGMGQSFMASLELRTAKRGTKKVAKVSATVPSLLTIEVGVKKYSVPIINEKAKYDLVVVEHGDMSCGRTNDFAAAEPFMEELGMWKKGPKGKGITCLDRDFPTAKAAWAWARAERLDEIRETIVKRKMPGAAATA